MKLVFAIVNNDDGPIVSSQITKAGFHVTKMASTGGFLMNGNTTFISGVEDDSLETLLDIIRKYSKRRKHMTPADVMYNPSAVGGIPIEVTVGGATVFVMNVERFERI